MDRVYANHSFDKTEGHKVGEIKLTTNQNALKMVLEFQNHTKSNNKDTMSRKYSKSTR